MAILLDAGDANLDGDVTYDDFLIIQSNFGQNDGWWEDGDFDANGVVDGEDLSAFWLNVDQGSLSPTELADINALATSNSVVLPNESLSIASSLPEVFESTWTGNPTAPTMATLTVQRTGDLSQPATVILSTSDSTELKLDERRW